MFKNLLSKNHRQASPTGPSLLCAFNMALWLHWLCDAKQWDRLQPSLRTTCSSLLTEISIFIFKLQENSYLRKSLPHAGVPWACSEVITKEDSCWRGRRQGQAEVRSRGCFSGWSDGSRAKSCSTPWPPCHPAQPRERELPHAAGGHVSFYSSISYPLERGEDSQASPGLTRSLCT